MCRDLFCKGSGVTGRTGVKTIYWDAPWSPLYGYKLINVGVRRPSLLFIALKMLVEMINQRYAIRSYHSALSIIDTKVDPDLGLDYICAKHGDPPQEERGGRPLPRVYRQWR